MTGLVWWLVACGGKEPAVEEQQETPVEEPSPYIYDDLDDDATAPYDQAAVEEALNEAFASAISFHAGPPIDAYKLAMEGATDDCPDYYSDGTNTYWYDYCTSSKGASFNGYSYYYAYDGYNDGTYTYVGDQVYVEAVIETADGDDFEGGGYAYKLNLTDADGNLVYYSVLGGAFSWTGGGVEDTWMGDGVRAETSMWISVYPEYDMNFISLAGGVTNLNSQYDTVSFTDVVYGSTGSWWSCPGEPGGTVSVRADDGTWFDVVFDVNPETWEVEEDLCDGCGTVWHRGEIVGEACPDPRPLTDWEDAPW